MGSSLPKATEVEIERKEWTKEVEVSVPTASRTCKEVEVPVPTEKLGGSSPQRKGKRKGSGKVKGIERKKGERRLTAKNDGQEEPLGFQAFVPASDEKERLKKER